VLSNEPKMNIVRCTTSRKAPLNLRTWWRYIN